MGGPTDSEFEMFKNLSNPQCTNFDNTSTVSRAILEEVHNPSTPPQRRPASDPPLSRQGSDPPLSRQGSVRPPSVVSERNTTHREEVVDDPAEKQSVLVELHALSRKGVQLSREFTMDDPIGDMTFELNRLQSDMVAADAAVIATDAMIMGMRGLEVANRKWGPILQLDGWADDARSKNDAYKNVFMRLYKKYVRKPGVAQPELALLGLIGGSAIMTHLDHVEGGQAAKAILHVASGMGKTAQGAFTQRPVFGSAPPRPDMPRPDMQRPSMPKPGQKATPPPGPSPVELENARLKEELGALKTQLHQTATSTRVEMVACDIEPRRNAPVIEFLN